MTKLLKKYNNIMKKYRSGEYGYTHLSMREILSKAGEPDLFDKMNLSEIQYLIDNSSGITKQLFSSIKSNRKISIEEIAQLEKELLQLNVWQNCDDSLSGVDLAKKLNLNVRYCKNQAAPDDIEATLAPSDNNNYNGVINIFKDSTSNFSFMHEIIHYLRDVGIGKKVMVEYTRKSKGKTEGIEEQEVNYLAAATIMPFNIFASQLEVYDHLEGDEENVFLSRLAAEYEQDVDAIARRFSEVSSLVDFGYSSVQ